MAMPGGYSGYGGHDGFHHDRANGHGPHLNGSHHAYSNGGGGGGPAGQHEDEFEQGDEDTTYLRDHINQLEREIEIEIKFANEAQITLEERAVARLGVEQDVRRMIQSHDEKIRAFQQKANEINEDCQIRDNKIKELTREVRHQQNENKQLHNQQQLLIEQAKRDERELALRRQAGKASGSGSGSGLCGSSGVYTTTTTTISNGGHVQNGDCASRRMQSSGASFFPRRASMGNGATMAAGTARATATAAGARTGSSGAATGSGGERSGGARQSNPQLEEAFEQIRQACVEDTLTDFFGL